MYIYILYIYISIYLSYSVIQLCVHSSVNTFQPVAITATQATPLQHLHPLCPAQNRCQTKHTIFRVGCIVFGCGPSPSLTFGGVPSLYKLHIGAWSQSTMFVHGLLPFVCVLFTFFTAIFNAHPLLFISFRYVAFQPKTSFLAFWIWWRNWPLTQSGYSSNNAVNRN